MVNEADFKEIESYAHFWNWLPDWDIAYNIYKAFPDSYSVLTPFALSYIEEVIRSSTSEYELPFSQRDGSHQHLRVGLGLLDFAIKENKDSNPEYVELLQGMRSYFEPTTSTNVDENRNGIIHGHLHPKYWSKPFFEKLIHDIALISKYAGFYN